MSTRSAGYDSAIFPEPFSSAYRTHLQHLKPKGLQPKTIDVYVCAILRMGGNFDFEVDDFAPAQLSHYFSDLIASHSWSAVKLDLYGSLEFTEYWPHNSG
jgi:integrase/recombinase XerD